MGIIRVVIGILAPCLGTGTAAGQEHAVDTALPFAPASIGADPSLSALDAFAVSGVSHKALPSP